MADSSSTAPSGFARCSRQPKVEIQQTEKASPLRSRPNNQLSETVLWLATVSSLGGTLMLTALGEYQGVRLAAFATFIPGNLIWIWYSCMLRSRQMFLLNSAFFLLSLVGIFTNC